MVAAQEEVGLQAVRAALAELERRAPDLHARMRLDKTRRSAQTGGSVHWCIAYQLGKVTNPSDATETADVRVAAQLTIQRHNSEDLLFAIARHRDQIESQLGHHLSWLPGGEAGGKLRSIIRSWRPLDGDGDELGRWMADEILALREALQPVLAETDLKAP